MQSFKLKIRQSLAKKDLKIIFEDGKNELHKIQVSKDDILQKLKYFEKKHYEVSKTDVIYIQENIDFDIFEKFISSISTQEIDINENNYEIYHYLSSKYEYEELQKDLDEFIQERPDISSTIDQILAQSVDDTNKSMNDQINVEKEELIAENLDICIQNGNLSKLPLQMLNRILNSPKRIVKNHHLLFNFIIELIQSKTSENLKIEELEDLQILPSSLDYCEMSNEEIEKLFSIENSTEFFKPRHSEERMKIFISKEQEMANKIRSMEEKIEKNENEYKNQIKELEKKLESNQKYFEQLIKNDLESISKQFTNMNDRNKELLLTQIKANEEEIVESKKRISINEKSIEEINKKLDIANKKIEIDQNHMNSKIQQNQNALSVAKNSINLIECENGIFQYFWNKYKSNPVQKGLVEINGNSYDSGNQKRLNCIIDPEWDSDWMSINKSNSYIKMNFKNHLIHIDKYRLRVGFASQGRIFTSWILKGTTEDNREIVLSEINNSSEITKKHPETTVSIQNNLFVSSIQLTMRDKNDINDYCMLIRNIEFFGCIKTI